MFRGYRLRGPAFQTAQGLEGNKVSIIVQKRVIAVDAERGKKNIGRASDGVSR